eukprot:Hpha_TRINITY_DN16172_c1_g1::TRINITY_DN16172_c1_g1_i3::g.7815::m.7815
MTPSGRAASPSRAMSPSGLSVSSIKEVPCSPGGLLALHQRLQAREEEKLRWLDARLNGGQAAGEGRKPPSYGRRTSQPTPPGQQQHGATTRVLGSSAAPTELSERLDRSRRVRRSWRDAGDIDAAIVTGLRVALLGRIERDAAAPPGSERALPDRVKAVFVSRSGVCVECAGSSEGGMLLGQLPKDGSGRCCLCGKVPEHPQVAPDGSQDAERRLSMHQVGDASVAAAVALRRVLTQAEGDRAAEWAAWAERISAAEQGKKSVDESPSSETQGVGAEALAISRILAVAVPSPGAWKEVQAAYEGRYGSESGGLRVETERRFEPEELRAVKQAVRRGGAVWSEEELRLAIVARCWSATTDDEAAVVTGVRVALLGHLEREAAAAPGSEGSLPAGLEAAFVARSGVCAECAAGAEGQVLLGELPTEASGRCRACGKVPEPPEGMGHTPLSSPEWTRGSDESVAAVLSLRHLASLPPDNAGLEWAGWAVRIAECSERGGRDRQSSVHIEHDSLSPKGTALAGVIFAAAASPGAWEELTGVHDARYSVAGGPAAPLRESIEGGLSREDVAALRRMLLVRRMPWVMGDPSPIEILSSPTAAPAPVTVPVTVVSDCLSGSSEMEPELMVAAEHEEALTTRRSSFQGFSSVAPEEPAAAVATREEEGGRAEGGVLRELHVVRNSTDWKHLRIAFASRHPDVCGGCLTDAFRAHLGPRESGALTARLSRCGVRMYSRVADGDTAAAVRQVTAKLRGGNDEWEAVCSAFSESGHGDLRAALDAALGADERRALEQFQVARKPRVGPTALQTAEELRGVLRLTTTEGEGSMEEAVLGELRQLKSAEQWGEVQAHFARRHSDCAGGGLCRAVEQRLKDSGAREIVSLGLQWDSEAFSEPATSAFTVVTSPEAAAADKIRYALCTGVPQLPVEQLARLRGMEWAERSEVEAAFRKGGGGELSGALEAALGKALASEAGEASAVYVAHSLREVLFGVPTPPTDFAKSADRIRTLVCERKAARQSGRVRALVAAFDTEPPDAGRMPPLFRGSLGRAGKTTAPDTAGQDFSPGSAAKSRSSSDEYLAAPATSPPDSPPGPRGGASDSVQLQFSPEEGPSEPLKSFARAVPKIPLPETPEAPKPVDKAPAAAEAPKPVDK